LLIHRLRWGHLGGGWGCISAVAMACRTAGRLGCGGGAWALFPRPGSARRLLWRKAQAISVMSACRWRPAHDLPSKGSRPRSSFIGWCACSHDQRALIAEAGVFSSVSAGRFDRWYFFSPDMGGSPRSQASSPGKCWLPPSPMRWTGPSATRTRIAAKRAASLPLVPARQLAACQSASAGIPSAARLSWSGTCRLRALPRPLGKIGSTSAGNPFRMRGMPTAQVRPRALRALAEGRTDALPGIRQHAAEADAGGECAVDLLECDPGPGHEGAPLFRHAVLVHPRGIGCPAFGQEQPQGDRHRHLATGQRQRHERPALGILAERARVAGRHTHPSPALLRQRVRRANESPDPLLFRLTIDDETAIRPASEPLSLRRQPGPERRAIPPAGRDEGRKGSLAAHPEALGHGGDAPAPARPDPPCHMERARRAPRRVTQPSEKRLQPAIQVHAPVRTRCQDAAPSPPTAAKSTPPKRSRTSAKLGIGGVCIQGIHVSADFCFKIGKRRRS
jgi:hypothetical protein